MMTTTLSLYDALGEDQLQGINGGRGKCSANEANKAMGNAFVGGFVGGLPVDSSPLWAQVEQVVQLQERVTGRHAGGKVVDLPDAKKLTRICVSFFRRMIKNSKGVKLK